MPNVGAGRYRLESQFERGPIYASWRGVDQVLGRPVVLKILHHHLAADEELKHRFQMAARAAAALVHPNIAAVYDTGEREGVPFIVMEYLGGGSLRERISNGALGIDEILTVGAGVSAGLARAHSSGVVHGYVTPETILFTERGQPKLGDFGIARATAPAGAALTSGLLESPAYLAPEQLAGDRTRPSADVYALGVILFECLTGRHPFPEGIGPPAEASRRTPPRPSDFRADVPSQLDALVAQALAFAPEERHPSAADLSTVLARLADTSTGGEVPPPPRRVPAETSFLKSEGRWLLPAILVVSVAAALVYLVLLLADTSPRLLVEDLLPRGQEGRVEIAAAGTHDPQGSRDENDHAVGRAFDGDPATAWPTLNYTTENFGGLKDGLGIWFDLGAPQRVTLIRVTSLTGGWEGTIISSDDPARWAAPGRSVRVDRIQEFETSGEHRYWMIWITRLVRTEGLGREGLPYSVGITEAEFFARR